MIKGRALSRLADLVVTHGWHDGVCAFINSCNPTEKEPFFQNLSFGAQAAWTLWVGRTNQDKVLNFDFGIGTTTVALSYLFRHVMGVFRDEASSTCARLHANYEGRSNVKVLVSTDLEQGIFQNSAFDLICLSDFPAWLGENEKDLQKLLDFLGSIFRLLAPGGMVYLGVKDVSLLSSVGVNHLWLRKRWLTSFLKKNKICVLGKLRFYPALGPIEMVFEVKTQRSWALWLRSNVQKMLRGESYGLILSKSWSSSPLGIIGDIASQNEVAISDGSDITVQVGTASTLVAKLPGRIVRFPLNARALSRGKINFQTLAQINVKGKVAIPISCKSGHFGDWYYFVESKLSGYEPAGRKRWSWKSDTITAQAFKYLVQLHGSTAQKVILDDMLFEELVGVPMKNLCGYSQSADQEIFVEAGALLKERLLGKEAVLVRTHGDYKRTNLLVDRKGKVVGVIDWDLSRESGFPFLDLLWYLSYEMCLEQSIPFHQAIVQMAFEEDLSMNYWVQSYWQDLSLGQSERQEIYASILLLYLFCEHQDHWHKADKEWSSHIMMPALRFAFKKALGVSGGPKNLPS
ncbi:MAG: phosphotransferase [Nitrospira sp.]|nr:phosphotransferase [Nitrospira sp.]